MIEWHGGFPGAGAGNEKNYWFFRQSALLNFWRNDSISRQNLLKVICLLCTFHGLSIQFDVLLCKQPGKKLTILIYYSILSIFFSMIKFILQFSQEFVYVRWLSTFIGRNKKNSPLMVLIRFCYRQVHDLRQLQSHKLLKVPFNYLIYHDVSSR